MEKGITTVNTWSRLEFDKNPFTIAGNSILISLAIKYLYFPLLVEDINRLKIVRSFRPMDEIGFERVDLMEGVSFEEAKEEIRKVFKRHFNHRKPLKNSSNENHS